MSAASDVTGALNRTAGFIRRLHTAAGIGLGRPSETARPVRLANNEASLST